MTPQPAEGTRAGRPARPGGAWLPGGWRLWAGLAPLGLVLGGLFGASLVLALAQALGHAPWFGVRDFPDPQYFLRLWTDPAFWTSLWLTLYYAAVATALALVLGLGLALALRRRFAGRAALLPLYRLPVVVPYAVGVALAALMMGNGGILSRLAHAAGLIDDPAGFPRLLHSHAGWGIIAVYVWKQLPFVALSVQAVLAGLPREMEEAAQVLGARRGAVLRHVVLPQVLPGLASAGLICFAFNIGAFEAPFILGGGYPDTLPVLAWRYFTDPDYAMQLQGMAVVVTLALVAGAILLAWLALYRRAERRMGRA